MDRNYLEKDSSILVMSRKKSWWGEVVFLMAVTLFSLLFITAALLVP